MTRTPDTDRTLTRTGAMLLAASRPLGRIALSCGLAGALGVGVTSAALANGHPETPGQAASKGKPSAPRGASAEPAGQRPAPKPAAERPAPKPAAERPASKPAAQRPASTPAAQRPAPQPAADRHAPQSSAERGSGQRTQDPAGNNGTIKVDGPAWDARVDNEPHTSCAFRVTFFGFDEGQTADITVTGVAPTGGGVLLHETAVPTSDDQASGAAQDFDGATRVFTADDLGLDAITPHSKQGYHLKVAVDSREAPGGAKQKVLWLEPCESAAPVTQPGTDAPDEGSEGGSVPAPGSQPDLPEQSETPATTRVAQPSEAKDRPEAPAVAAYRETSAPAAELASSVNAVRPTQQASALPTGLAFTGAGGLGLMALAGAGAAAAGTALQVARRRAAVRTD